MRATRPDPICRGADPEIVLGAEKGAPRLAAVARPLLLLMQSNMASPYMARRCPRPSDSSAGSNIILSAVDA
jgi:hypothetical protein